MGGVKPPGACSSVAPLKGGATLRYGKVPVAIATECYATATVLQPERSVPLAALLEAKSKLREERSKRKQAEAERDALKVTLGHVLQVMKDGGR